MCKLSFSLFKKENCRVLGCLAENSGFHCDPNLASTGLKGENVAITNSSSLSFFSRFEFYPTCILFRLRLILYQTSHFAVTCQILITQYTV